MFLEWMNKLMNLRMEDWMRLAYNILITCGNIYDWACFDIGRQYNVFILLSKINASL